MLVEVYLLPENPITSSKPYLRLTEMGTSRRAEISFFKCETLQFEKEKNEFVLVLDSLPTRLMCIIAGNGLAHGV